VIVGSGIGSLYCAALLSRAGYVCLVLEQHYVAGGCTHDFHDGGYSFDTGLHYVGRMEKYSALFDLVSTGSKVKWEKMGTEADGYCYDEIKLGEAKPYPFRAGEENFIADLSKEFPTEVPAIKEYVRLCKRANKKADMYFYARMFSRPVQWLLNKFMNKEYFKYANTSTWDMVSSLTTNKRLRAILCGQFGDYGLKPQDSSFLIQAGIAAHYLGGAYYPIGGSGNIAKAIIPTIEAAGGRVLVSCRVKELKINKSGKCVGVEVFQVDKSGQNKGDAVTITATKGVISGAGAAVTHNLTPKPFQKLLGYAPMLANVKSSISHAYAFIGMKGTTEELGLRAANLWVLPCDEDYNYEGAALDASDKGADGRKVWEGKGDSMDKEDMLLFVGFPSVKDPEYSKNHPGKSACEMITTAHPEWFEQFNTAEKPQSGKRNNAEYTELKKELEKKMLNGLYRNYPKTRGKVDYVSIATPLTNKYYLGRNDSYGLEHTMDHYGGALNEMRPATDIAGLWCTGQDIGTVGIVGALNGGILTAHAVLGYGLWDLVVEERNLIEDLMRGDKIIQK
jgi:all-trans-retinol 13,14-reductase